MAKTPKRRHYARRLHNKWMNLLKSLKFSDEYIEKCTFGKSMTRDPFDCGRPNCRLCHGKKSYPKERRSQNKAIAKQELNSLLILPEEGLQEN